MRGCGLWPGRSHFSLTRLPPFVIITFFFPLHPLPCFFTLPIATWFINFIQWKPQWWNPRVQTGYIEPIGLLEKGLHVHIAKTNFFIWMNLEQFFLQLVIINAYSWTSTWHVLFSSFLNKYEFLKVSWFLVNSVFRFLKW